LITRYAKNTYVIELNDGRKENNSFLIVDDVDREAVRRSFAKENTTNPLIEAENGLEAINFLKTKEGEYLKKTIIVLLD